MVYNGSQLKQADALGKLINLRELIIQSYCDTLIGLGTHALSKLVRIKIHGLNFVHLPSLELLPHLKSTIDAFPTLEELSFECMSAIKEWRLAKQPNKWMQCLRKLNVSDCRELQVLPPVPVGVKELRFAKLGLNALPNLWNDQSNKSALVIMDISYCENLKSLNEGLLQNPERFVALKELSITGCPKLMNLPPGGFNNFISLKKLNLSDCPNIQVEEKLFLPCTLQNIKIIGCGDSFDTNLPKALESIHSLIELELSGCKNITCLPSKEVFSKWKTLKSLILMSCPVLESLESLLGLSSIEHLSVCGCPKLLTSKDEINTLLPAYPRMSKRNSKRSISAQPAYPSPSSTMVTGNTSALEIPPLSVILAYLQDFEGSISAQPQPQPQSPCSTMKTRNTSAQRKPLFSVNELEIDDPLLLSIEPMRRLLAVRKLTLFNCSKLQSLRKLPLSFQELCIRYCSPELQKWGEKSGPDWPKLYHIPEVEFHLNCSYKNSN